MIATIQSKLLLDSIFDHEPSDKVLLDGDLVGDLMGDRASNLEKSIKPRLDMIAKSWTGIATWFGRCELT